MISEKLTQAVLLIKAGNKQSALPLLKEVIQAEPSNETAWLWLYACVESASHKKYCLQKAIEINPDNQPARRALEKLINPTSVPAPQSGTVKTALQSSLRVNKTSPKKDYRPLYFIFGVCLLLFLCLVPITYLALTGKISSLAVSLPISPVSTATQPLVPTELVVSSPSPSSVPTSTLPPSPIPTSISIPITPTRTLQPASFKPGDPTATPLGSEINNLNFVQGIAAYNAKNYEKVIDLMGAVITVSPELAPPYRYRGMAYWYLGDCVSGLADQEKALALNPNYAVAWADRALMKDCLGNPGQALEDYQKALALDPSLAFVHLNLGVYYYNLGDYETALEEYSLSSAIDPTRSDAWRGKSSALAQLGQYQGCIENSSQAIQLNSEDWLAYSYRAYCELSLENFPSAASDYEIFVKHSDEVDSRAWYNFGIAQRNIGSYQKSIESYSKALELEPSYYPAHINRGSVYVLISEFDRAWDDFNAALEYSEIPLAYSGRGDVYYGKGKYTQAIAEYKKAIALAPGLARGYCQMSFAYFALNDYQNALESGETSYQIDRSCGGQKLFEILARSSYSLKDYDKGIEYMNKALAIKPYPLGYYYRGIIFQAKGLDAEAIQDLEQFLRSNPGGKESADAKARLVKLKP